MNLNNSRRYRFLCFQRENNFFVVIVQLQDCWFRQDPNLSKVSALRESSSISIQHIPIYVSLTLSWPPLLSLYCPSRGAFELFIPVVMTSSGTCRRRLRCPACLVKNFATSCETIKYSDRAWHNCLLLKAPIAKCSPRWKGQQLWGRGPYILVQ